VDHVVNKALLHRGEDEMTNAESESATSERSGRPLVEVEDLRVHFRVSQRVFARGDTDVVKAIDGVSLTLDEGTTLGVVGESGSGKSTLARVLMRMVAPTSGTVLVDGIDLRQGTKAELRRFRRVVQIVFQDPFSSLDPRMNVGNIVAEPLTISQDKLSSADLRGRVADLLEMVHLSPDSVKKYPHQFSGGQRQRIAIARALATNPRLLVLDEPTSALDVSVRAQILKLLKELQEKSGLSYVIISHDLSTVAQMATNVGVMYLGRMVEFGPSKEVFTAPAHPYTQALLSSVPGEDAPETLRLVADYEIPSPMQIPAGCRFKLGCMLRQELGEPESCDTIDPPIHEIASHRTACHFPEQAIAVGAHLRGHTPGGDS
jgi:oligopeptide transport system ATP-binding protein